MVDLKIYDDGKGLKVVATPVNKAGNPMPLPTGETLAYTLSDPTVGILVQDPSDPSGLTQDFELASPPVDETGITITLTGTDTNGNQVTDVSPPFDIVADGFGGFAFALTAE